MLPGDGGQKSTFEKGLYHDSFLITSFFSRLPRYLSSLYDDIAGSGNPLQLEDFHKCQKSSIILIFCKGGILYIPDIMKLCLALGLGRHVGGCTPYLSQDAPAYAWYALAYAYSHPQTACLSHLSPHLSHQGKHCHAYFYTTVYHRLCVICSYGQVTKSDVLDVCRTLWVPTLPLLFLFPFPSFPFPFPFPSFPFPFSFPSDSKLAQSLEKVNMEKGRVWRKLIWKLLESGEN